MPFQIFHCNLKIAIYSKLHFSVKLILGYKFIFVIVILFFEMFFCQMKSEFYVIFLKFSKWFFRFFPVSEYHFAYISTFHKKLTWFCGYFPPTFKISLLISRRNLANLAPKLNASLRGSGYTSIDSLAKKPRPYGRCTRIVLEE